MKLRNKKTGEIIDDGYVRETHDFQFDGQKQVLAVFKGNGHRPPERVSGAYKSLAELNEEWEDAPEEPKTFFTIYYDGTIPEFKDGDDDQIRDMKEIGNYFETREEAEKAVEKLKAWKRIKKGGFRFISWDSEIEGEDHFDCCGMVFITGGFGEGEVCKKDLDLLFGGEE